MATGSSFLMCHVDILLPVKNCQTYLKETLESLSKQSFDAFTVWIIDDSSSDGTAAIATDWAQKDLRFHLCKNPGSGIVDALEFGRTKAKGKYIARMDGDDIALPDRLSKQVDFLSSHANVVALGGQTEIIDAVGNRLRGGRFPASADACRAHLMLGSCFCHPAVMMRRDAVEAAGGYRKEFDLAEDYDLWLRLSRQGELSNLDSVILKYRIHGANVSLKKASVCATISALAFIDHQFPETKVARLENFDPSQPWEDTEALVPKELQGHSRAAYYRSMTLSGAIVEDQLTSKMLASIAGAMRNKPHGPTDKQLTFTLNRAAYQNFRTGHYRNGVACLRTALCRMPISALRDVSNRL
jgi:hypothetical protein